jgi:hypothetical protein
MPDVTAGVAFEADNNPYHHLAEAAHRVLPAFFPGLWGIHWAGKFQLSV